MAGSVDTVGSEVYLKHEIILDIVVFSCRTAYHRLCLGRKDDDTVVRRTYTDLILRADHAERLHAADFRFLDLELAAVGSIEGSAYGSHYHNLTGVDIGSAAYNLGRRTAAVEINGGYMKMIAVGMSHACEHLAYDNACKAAADTLYALYRSRFKAYRSQQSSQLLGSEVEIDIFFKPFI